MDWVQHWADTRPSESAVIDGELRLSWAELAVEVRRWSAALVAAGVEPGDRVAMRTVPGASFLLAFLGVASVGAIWVGLNPRYTPSELDRVVDALSPRLVLADECESSGSLSEWMQRMSRRAAVVVLDGAARPSVETLEAFLRRGEEVDVVTLSRRLGAADPREPCLIVFTSGSTAAPKGVLISQVALTGASEVQVREWGVAPLRVLNNLPISHIGCVGDLTCFALVGGGALVFMPRFDPDGVLRMVHREGVTVLGQVPSMFMMMLERPGFDSALLASLRLLFWGGAPAPAELVRRLRRLTPWLATSYGQTETVGSVTFTHRDATEEELSRTVGHAVPPYLVRIRGIDGMPQVGEVEIQSPFRFLGYWRDGEATTRAVDADGWLRTGDLGNLDPSGALELKGRVHRVFKSGGYNISPAEIEEVLLRVPGVEDACVVGIEDDLWGRVPVAFVVASHVEPDAAAILGQLRGTLANYKVPKKILFMEKLPRLAIGKVDAQALLATLTRER